jgi:putative hydrolase of the HAD superfamily
MIKNLIFDFSDTLMRFGGLDWLREVAGDEERAMHIHCTMFMLPEWPIYDKGDLDGETVKTKLAASLDDGNRELGLRYFDEWYRHHTMIEGIPELLAELKAKGYGIYLLSDYPECFEYNWEKFADFFQIFDGRGVSYELHSRKRERTAFPLMLDRYGLKAEESYFVDDLGLNIEAARECGLRAHQFTTTECLREELNKLGIL